MDEQARAAKHEEAINQQIAFYNDLKNLSNSADVQKVLDLFLKTATEKIVRAFTTDTIKDWNDFCKLRGEVFSCLYPVQEVRGAQSISDHLRKELDNLYPKQQ